MLATATIALLAPGGVPDRSVDLRWNPNAFPGSNSDHHETEYGWRRTRQFTFALRHCNTSTVGSLKNTLAFRGFRRIPGVSGCVPPGQRRCWGSDLLSLLPPGPNVADVASPATIGVTLLQLGELSPTPLFQSPLINPGNAAVAVIRLLSRRNLVIESLRLCSRQNGFSERLDLMTSGDTLIYDPFRISIGALSCIRPDTRVPGTANIMCLALGDCLGLDRFLA
jgi:hypothetical protein